MIRFIFILFASFVCVAQQTRVPVNVGTSANDGTGDPVRNAFIKLNTNDYKLWRTVYTNFPINVKDYGANPADAADDTSAIQSAINAAGDGGTVYFPPGSYYVSATLTNLSARRLWGSNGSFFGSNPSDTSGTRIVRTVDLPILRMQGVNNGSGMARQLYVSDISFGGSGFSSPMVELYYAMLTRWERVQWYSEASTGQGGPAIQGLSFWDSHFNSCRFDQVGGTNSFAVNLVNNTGSIVLTNGNCNNLTFLNCTWEQSPRWFNADRQGVGFRHNRIRFIACKFETIQWLCSPLMSFDSTADLSITDSFFAFGTLFPSYSAATNLLWVNDAIGFKLDGLTIEGVNALSFADCIAINNSSGVGLSSIYGYFGITNTAPTNAIVAFTGSNTGHLGGVNVLSGSAASISGSLTGDLVSGEFFGNIQTLTGNVFVGNTNASSYVYIDTRGTNLTESVVQFRRNNVAVWQLGMGGDDRLRIYDAINARSVAEYMSGKWYFYDPVETTGTITSQSTIEANSGFVSKSAVFANNNNSIVLTATNTWYNLGTGKRSGLYVLRDQTSGGGTVVFCDTSAVPAYLTNAITGLEFRYDSGTTNMQARVTSGTVPRNVRWVLLQATDQ